MASTNRTEALFETLTENFAPSYADQWLDSHGKPFKGLYEWRRTPTVTVSATDMESAAENNINLFHK